MSSGPSLMQAGNEINRGYEMTLKHQIRVFILTVLAALLPTTASALPWWSE